MKSNTIMEDLSSEMHNIERGWLRKPFIVFSVIVCTIIGVVVITFSALKNATICVAKEIKFETVDLWAYCKETFINNWTR